MSGHQGRSALRKPEKALTRRALLSIREREDRTVAEAIRDEIRRSIEAIDETVLTLRKHHGISVPTFKLEWDPIATDCPTPARTIEAYCGNRGNVRVTLMLDGQVDDTTDDFLQLHGVSHLIAIDVDSVNSRPTCLSETDGGMLARIKTTIDHVAWILHDVFIDMAVVHAAGQIWSGIRGRLTAFELAAQKVQFARTRLATMPPPLIVADTSLYIPICSLARTGLSPSAVDLDRCIELWTKFSERITQTGVASLNHSRAEVAANILKQHVKGGQIAPRRLIAGLEELKEGHYRFYFLERGTDQSNKICQIAQFFSRNPAHFRTQWWIIRCKGHNEKAARMLISEGFISEYPFYIGAIL